MDKSKVVFKYKDEVRETSEISDSTTVGQLKSNFFVKTGVSSGVLEIRLAETSNDDNSLSSRDSDPGDFEMVDLVDATEENEDVQKDIENSSEITETQKDESASGDSAAPTASNVAENQSYEILEMKPLDVNKKLLITNYENILAYRASQFMQWPRPQLNHVMHSVSCHYNIVIWSLLDIETVMQELSTLSVLDNSNYVVAFGSDKGATAAESNGTKALDLIWTKYPEYSVQNTVAVATGSDFTVDKLAVLKIEKYGQLDAQDRELVKLARYLELLAEKIDFSQLDHSTWRESSATVRGVPFSNLGAHSIQEIAPLEVNKKLLICNLDKLMYSKFFDISTCAHLREFFEYVYPNYNIAIWSRYDVPSMIRRARILSLTFPTNFKISFYLSYCPEYSKDSEEIRSEVMNIVWSTYQGYSPQNTIVADNDRFDLKNMTLGLSISEDFLQFADYLDLIADFDHMQLLNHSTWKAYSIEEHRQRLGSLIRVVQKSMSQLTIKPQSASPAAVNLDELEIKEILNPVHLAEDLEIIINRQKIKERYPMRENKKLLVLNVDGVLGHCNCNILGPHQRPYLIEFLNKAYDNYNIIIWGDSDRETIEQKLKHLEVESWASRCKILAVLDAQARLTVLRKNFGWINVKPLQLIWKKYPEYSARNTIMIDDQSFHFLLNPKAGLKIETFSPLIYKRYLDRELLKLTKYLQLLAEIGNFTVFDHNNWEEYIGAYFEGLAFDNCGTTLDTIFGYTLGEQIGAYLGMSNTADLREHFGEDYVKNLTVCLDIQDEAGENVVEKIVRKHHVEIAVEQGSGASSDELCTFSVTIKFNQEREVIADVHDAMTEAELKIRIYQETMFSIPPENQCILYPVPSTTVVQYRPNSIGSFAKLKDLGVTSSTVLQLMPSTKRPGFKRDSKSNMKAMPIDEWRKKIMK